ncbi:extracellular solute-binding protein [Fervidibacillus halotolerans]|uniref:Extracellular solute-binding protein n=1 Tax=Fervidibacillus halotolerans TaxID=2980027 RepID=A0A9E8RYG8_9BACI|nr:extracellular solute-binding protein [Fervidibacillus halotolerans]WAA12228.1 extracellular solute-binding protein [Fervidibacillus halotolerans]
MKKWLSRFLVFSLALFLLAACSGNGDESGSDEGGTDETSEPTVIKFAAQNDNTPATQAVIDAFNNSQDQYKVEWEVMTNDSGQMHDQLLTSLSSGSDEYDVLSLDVVWAGEFAGAGYLEPIDTFMNDAGLNKGDYNAGSMASGNYKGKQYTLPFFPDLGLLYYRSDILSEEDAAKLESGNYTYDDLAAMAEKYVGEQDTKYGFVYQSAQYEGLTVNLTEFTGAFSDLKGGLQKMYEFTTADFTPEDILTYTEGETHTAFEQGLSVFARNWPYAYGRIQSGEDGVNLSLDQVGVAPLPNGSAVGGWLLAINSSSKNIDGAWEFIKFVAGEEGQKIMSTEGGYLPGYNPLLSDQTVIDSNALLSFEGFKNALGNTIARPVSPDYSKISDTIQVHAHKYLSSGEDLDGAVQAIEEGLSE